ncbi:hypothetical protein HNR42_003009 [Deinobacterium chartae]|uniref:CAAX prenyl protease 2/Lysostaphin resistance protein A-like domain-containing protein n=1 Tax=Deinobacterium chartae TaxID=521158 RepID=A0A841I5L0_9DEIO|nr:hypothetical protein [Deinobacterium chartae]
MPDPEATSATAPSPLEANRAVLVYLLLVNVLPGLALLAGWPVGLSLLLSAAVALLLTVLVFRRAFAALARSGRLSRPPPPGLTAGSLLLTLPGALGLGLVAGYLLPQVVANTPQLGSEAEGLDLLWLFVAVAGVVPLAEELVFRGLLLGAYERVRPLAVAALWTAGVFLLAHASPVQLLTLIPLSWIAARAVQVSGSLWTSVLLHAVNNLLALGVSQLAAQQASDAGVDEVTLSLALGGLLVGGVCLWIAVRWLRPKPQPYAPGPLVSGSLIAVIVLCVAGLAASLLLPLAPPGG